MEGIQAVSWQVVEPYEKLQKQDFSCNSFNKFMTFLSLLNIWLQPVSFCLFGYMSKQKHARTLFIIPLVTSLVNLVAIVWSCFVGEVYGELVNNHPTQLDGVKFCTYHGPHGQ